MYLYTLKRFSRTFFCFFFCVLLIMQSRLTNISAIPKDEQEETIQESDLPEDPASSKEAIQDDAFPQENDPMEGNSLSDSIQSNQIPNWPLGPEISAAGAILLDADTGTILYEKNAYERFYPASTTKILTTLVAIERSNLEDMVTFSRNAVFSIDRDSSNMGMDAGQSITMEQCLYGILVHSANEVANAVAEHISGDIASYVELMNQKASELGCLDSHFVTTNGLHDENHYTTPYDLAQIGRSFFQNETLSKIAGTSYYEIQPTETQPDLIPCYTHNQITRGQYTLEGYIGGKTGYTTQARQTLVTCAERNGMKLICVVMKDESPSQFTDTISLFEYGFANFQKVRACDYGFETGRADFFQNNNDVFGIEGSLISVDQEDYIILPNTISFADLDSKLNILSSDENQEHIATIELSYEGILLGSANVNLANEEQITYDFESPATEVTQETFHEDTDNKIIFVDVLKILSIAVVCIIIIVILILILSVGKMYAFSAKNRVVVSSGPVLSRPTSPRRRKKRAVFRRKKDNRIRIKDTGKRKRKKRKNDLHF